MRKIIAFALVSIMAFFLVGCETLNRCIDDIPGKNPTGDPDAEYWGYMILESDEDLSQGWEIYKEKQTEDNMPVVKNYFFDDSAIDGYKTVYYFEAPNAWMTYPISIEDYFSNANCIVRISHLINRNDGYCQCGRGIHETIPYIPEEQKDYLQYPLISLDKADSLDSTEIISLDDLSLISYEMKQGSDGLYTYNCSYDGVPVFVISSCTELSDSAIHSLFEHIIIME